MNESIKDSLPWGKKLTLLCITLWLLQDNLCILDVCCHFELGFFLFLLFCFKTWPKIKVGILIFYLLQFKMNATLKWWVNITLKCGNCTFSQYHMHCFAKSMFNVEILCRNFLKLFHGEFAEELIMADVHRSEQSFRLYKVSQTLINKIVWLETSQIILHH